MAFGRKYKGKQETPHTVDVSPNQHFPTFRVSEDQKRFKKGKSDQTRRGQVEEGSWGQDTMSVRRRCFLCYPLLPILLQDRRLSVFSQSVELFTKCTYPRSGSVVEHSSVINSFSWCIKIV